MQIAQGLLPLASAVICQARDRAARTDRDTAAAQLKAQHPELVRPAETKGGSLVAAAKNLRTQLRHAFPGVKFSVTTDRFSGGDSLRVAWIDGPAVSRVETIASQYKAGNFNGYDDIYEYSHTAWTEAFGDAKYVSCSRDYSPDLTAWMRADDLPYSERHEAQCNRRSTLYRLSIKSIKKAEA
jgi:hypothetical protein